MRKFLTLTILLSLFATALSAQMMKRIQIPDGTPVHNLAELGAIIIEQDGVVKFLFVPPTKMRAAAYKNVDVQDDDVILFANGKRIRTLDVFKELIESTKIDSVIQLGLKRGDKRFIAAFKKADPDDLPKSHMVMRKSPGDKQVVTKSGPSSVSWQTDGDLKDARPLLGLHILVKNVDDKPVVATKFDFAEGLDLDFKENDKIIGLNGKEITSFNGFFDNYETLKSGSEVSFKIQRGEKTKNITFTKPKVKARMMRR